MSTVPEPDTGGVGESRPEGGDSRRVGPATAIFSVLALALLAFAVYQALSWPDVGILRQETPETTAFIERYRERQRESGASDGVRWQPVPYDRISPHLRRAVLVAEDITFFQHDGFAVEELKNAVEEALSGERVRGASTITQQLAKNLWLSPSRNPLRKVKEAILTLQLESKLSKRRILDLYLNVVEFGPGIYGAEAASRHYFGKAAADLSEREAAQLAAALPRPSTWHPGSSRAGYERHVERILNWMDRAEFLWRYI